MTATPSDPLRHATIASILPHRESLFVAAWHFERRWLVSGSANNGILISGTTPDLHQLPEVIRGWAEGAGLDEISRAARFDVLTGRFEVPDNNPADLIASEWQWKLTDARNTDWPEYQALIETAYAEPKLRRLSPYTSMWALGFAVAPNVHTPSFVSVSSPRGAGDYTVREWWDGPVLAQVATPTEAISIAVSRIPASLLHTPAGFTADSPESST